MPTELEELVGFLGSPNPQIRQIALENCVGYSHGPQAALFKPEGLKPIKNLKILVGDIPTRAKHALTILINLTADDTSIRGDLVNDDVFVELLLSKITDPKYLHADSIAMLLANLAKDENIKKLLTLQRPEGSAKGVSTSKVAMDQLVDCFVKGAEKKLNENATFDYLSYFFADLSSFVEGRKYFITKQSYDGVVPISKVVVFTSHESSIRRKGVASTIKNVCFEIPYHSTLLNEDEIDLLPYILLPVTGPEELSEEDMDGMHADLQLLPPDKERDPDMTIITTHLESLLLLTTTQQGREYLRMRKVYPIIRETHLHIDDEDVTMACDRIVQVLMRDEEPEEKVVEAEEEDESGIVEIL